MIDLNSLWAQIELEQKWRTDEIRFFDNQATRLLSKEDQNQFRRANILLLYAHYEGFCKFAFTLYVDTINAEGLRCKEANFSIAAAALDQLFKELRNPESKAIEFKNSLPEDKKLHVFARDKAFLERSTDFDNKLVNIPENVVDMESNLKPVVLRKNLYRLGFPHNGLELIEGYISMLLNERNQIAHGANGIGIESGKYESLRAATFEVMNAVKKYIMNALTKEEFRRI